MMKRMSVVRLALAALAGVAMPSFATTWYVDAENGNDAWNGQANFANVEKYEATGEYEVTIKLKTWRSDAVETLCITCFAASQTSGPIPSPPITATLYFLRSMCRLPYLSSLLKKI